uniref:TgMIC10 n=1 Tax=Toxoplasma gondii TaxID=5811 RepID=Q9GSV5_TOXGO|nr:TgMIC10 precursor [Toxoplasma gondii]
MALSSLNNIRPFSGLLGCGLLFGALVVVVACVFSVPVEAGVLRKVAGAGSLQASIGEHDFFNDYDQDEEYRKRHEELQNQSPEEVEEAKRKYHEELRRKAEEDAETKRKQEAVIQELKEVAKKRGLREAAEREEKRIDEQQANYEQRQQELRDMDSAMEERLMQQRKKDQEERELARKNSDKVMEELKEKLARRRKSM